MAKNFSGIFIVYSSTYTPFVWVMNLLEEAKARSRTLNVGPLFLLAHLFGGVVITFHFFHESYGSLMSLKSLFNRCIRHSHFIKDSLLKKSSQSI